MIGKAFAHSAPREKILMNRLSRIDEALPLADVRALMQKEVQIVRAYFFRAVP
jgi:hypothetical protein